jgi:hypothetical protein
MSPLGDLCVCARERGFLGPFLFSRLDSSAWFASVTLKNGVRNETHRIMRVGHADARRNTNHIRPVERGQIASSLSTIFDIPSAPLNHDSLSVNPVHALITQPQSDLDDFITM